MPLRRWLTPLVLAGLATSSTAGAVTPAPRGDPAAIEAPAPVTPVLSLRRAPEVIAEPTARRRTGAEVARWLAAQPGPRCLAVAAGGELLVEENSTAPLVPASTMKLVTATAALLALGADATYETVVAAERPLDGGTIDGDVWLVGGGDPLLGTAAYFRRDRRQPRRFTDLGSLAAAVRDAGVRRIAGSVVGDDSRYDRARAVANWPSRFVAQHAGGPLSALVVNHGFRGYAPDWDDRTALVPAADPPAHAAEELTRLLVERGIDVAGSPRAGVVPSSARPIATLRSAPVHVVVGEVVRFSDNTAAELLVKELGRRVHGRGTTTAGLDAIDRTLRDAGIDSGGVRVADGSGIAPDNRVTCALLVELLRRPGTGPTLVAGLAVAGRSGTLRDRFVGSPLAGRLRAKTGSLATSSALAGVLRTRAGATLTFAYLVNGAGAGSIAVDLASVRDGLGPILDRYPSSGSLAVLGPVEVPRS